jgi:lysozyme family protein
MADFIKAFNRTLHFEGDEQMTNDPDDPGGRTRFGIAENYWPKYWKNGPPTHGGALRFYREEFWNKMRGDDIEDQKVANEIFDTAVNCGKSTFRFVQECYNRLTEDRRTEPDAFALFPEIAVDGIIGPITLDAINNFCLGASDGIRLDWRDALLAAMDYRQADIYWNGNAKYRRGWFAKRIGGHHESS